MADLTIGSTYPFSQIVSAYRADRPTNDEDQLFILHRGSDIVALCLRHKFHPDPGEVWVAEAPPIALWGERLAQCKGAQTVPLYYSPRGRSFFEFKGHHLIAGDTTDPAELAKRKGPVPLSRIVFLEKARLTPAAARR